MTLEEITAKCDKLRDAKTVAFQKFRALQATADDANLEYMDARDALVKAETEWTVAAQEELNRRRA